MAAMMEEYLTRAEEHQMAGDVTRRGQLRARSGGQCGACGVPPTAALLRFAQKYQLTNRELEVTRCAASGSSNREIAAHLGLSTRTVEGHLQRAYEKLGVHSRVRLALQLQTVTD
jgi:DNA-binding CsgD family transcriptional regulator